MPLLAALLLGPVPEALTASCGGGDLPTIAATIRPAEWQVLGPFSVGPREGITGIDDDPDRLVPSSQTRYPSMLVQRGFVRWQVVSPDSLGWVTVKFDSVSWDTLADVYGAPGVACAAYAHCEFECGIEARALIVAEKVGSFHLNGVECLGDPYGHDFVRTPVVLRKGTNRVLAKLSGYGDPSFKFEVIPASAPLIFLDDYTTPDIIRGEQGRFWVGIPIVNTTPATISRATLSVGDGISVARSHRVIYNLTSLCVRKIPVEIEVLSSGGQRDDLPVPIEIRREAGPEGAFIDTVDDTLHLRVREPGQSFKRTFISRIDCSCQYYAVLPPKGYADQACSLNQAPHQSLGKYALILTLHGANVRAEGQVDAYKPKSWAFVVAPTNRRRFGFDWQDWGRLDAVEVLEEVKSSYPIDPDRVYLTGHSMGGHGVWHVGLAHPHLFAAMGPGAGWTSFDLYVPWFLQKSSIYAEPWQIGPRNASLREDAALNFVENALNLPVFVFQGGADDNVPPTHARMFVDRLEKLRYTYKYKELPGKGHWWGIDSLGTSCVDDPDLMGFFQGVVRDSCPSHVILRTTNLGRSDRAYWVTINRQEVPLRESRIEAIVVDGPGTVPGRKTLRIRTENVDQFTVGPCSLLQGMSQLSVTIDGWAGLLEKPPARPMVFSRRAGGLRLGETRSGGLEKSPDSYGPIKQAYFSPFVLVYGTAGDSLATEILLNQARTEAWQWWIRGNGHAEILPDSAVTAETIEDYNLILFGGPEENLVTRMLNRHLPIRVIDGKLRVGADWIGATQGASGALAAEFVYPNPLSQERLAFIHEGIGPDGLKLSTFFGTLYSGAGLPDFVIFDQSVETKGWGGVIAAGFFDSRWSLPKIPY